MKILDIVEFEGNIANKMVLDTYAGALPANTKTGQIFYANASTTSVTPTTLNTNQTGVFVPSGSAYLRLDNIYNTHSDILTGARGILSAAPADGSIITWNNTAGKFTSVTVAGLNALMTLADLSDSAIGTPIKGEILIHDGTKWVDGSIVGTANQVLVDSTTTTGQIKLSLPQDIALTSTPQFQGINILNASAQALATVKSTGSTARLDVIGASDAFILVGKSDTANAGFNYDSSEDRLNIGVSTNTDAINANAYGPTSISIRNISNASAINGSPIEFGSFIKLVAVSSTLVESPYYTTASLYKDNTAKGLMYFDSTSSTIRFFDGSNWQSLLYGSGSGYIVSVSQGTGITITGAASNPVVSAVITGDTSKGLTVTQGVGVATTITLAQDIKTSATPQFAGLTMGGITLTASANPSNPYDIITLDYFQKQTFGTRDFKESVFVATIAVLQSSAFVAGVITDSTAGSVLTIDGLALTAANVTAGKTRVLVKNQANAFENGIYVITTIGVASTTKWVLTRASDFNTMSSNVTGQTLPNISNGAYVFVGAGGSLSKTGWVLNNADAALTAINTSAIDFVQFTGAGSILGTANRITVTGTTIDISANYVGQASITTVGTIASGIWRGTAVEIAYGGTGATTKTVAFNNLSPLTSTGDLISHDGTNNVRVAGNTSTTKQFLSSTGNGSASLLPVWGVLAAGDIPALDASKITSGTLPVGRGGTGLTTYTVGSILYASATTTIAGLAVGGANTVLLSNGTLPSWGKVGLTTHVSGILPFANGGTGIGATAGVADAGKVLVINAGGTGWELSTNAQARTQKITWTLSGNAATALTTGPYFTGAGANLQRIVTHTLNSKNVIVSLIDDVTGEIYMCSYYSYADLNVASPVSSTSTIVLKFSAAGWAVISGKTTLTIILQAM